MCDEELVGRLAGRFYGELPLPTPPLPYNTIILQCTD